MINKEFWKGKRVFVTGHTGFKGCWLCEILLYLGADVTGYALAETGEADLFQLLKLSGKLHSHIADIRDITSLQRAMGACRPEIVYHLAAQPLVLESYENPVYTYETNVMGTVNLLEAVRETDGIKSVVNITTDKVYKNKEWDRGFREEEELCGYDPYSNSKSCSELVTHSYKVSFFNAETAPAVSTARAGNVIGGGDLAKDRIIPDCIRAASEQRVIQVRNPNSVRPYQHVLDCLAGYLILAEKQYHEKKRYAGAYNFGPNDVDCITTGALAELFVKEWNKMDNRVGASRSNQIGWESISALGPHEAGFLKLNSEKARNVLSWYPKMNIQMAVQKTVEWAISYGESRDASAITEKQIKDYLEN